MGKILFWHRRDIRISDNKGLYEALISSHQVIPVFVFDSNILSELPDNDRRVNLIYDQLMEVRVSYQAHGGDILIQQGNPIQVIPELCASLGCSAVYTNSDYEPYAISRDQQIKDSLERQGLSFHSFKDQVVFEPHEVLKKDGTPYTVFTPFKRRWLEHLRKSDYQAWDSEGQLAALEQIRYNTPSKSDLGIVDQAYFLPTLVKENIDNYEENRNFPAVNKCSFSSVYLRFGMVSARSLVRASVDRNETYLSELVWREFFMMILWHFPKVVHSNFRAKYDGIQWRNNKEEFEAWCKGETGYPIVDAGMRELNETGYMHNRVRMIVASFLCKHLLIDWRWGEAYFAKQLMDFELSSNNGNWQWAAGTGCDASPYFRVFNPYEQTKKFDKKLEYIKKWVPDLNEFSYPQAIVEHTFARKRAIDEYKLGIARTSS
jgi:deoxyribodipyrimidine photo-lyase